MMSDAKMRYGELTLIAAVAAVLACFCGCGKKDEPPADPYDTPYARMHDPEYLKLIKEQKATTDQLMKRMADVRTEMAGERAKGVNADQAKVAELEQRLTAIADEIESNRVQAVAMVRARIQRERAAIDAKNEKNLKEKGN